MTINQKEKGKRGEREWAKFCRDHGFKIRRTVQYCGNTGDASDCVGLDGFHQEVKRTERLRIYDAYAQAQRDAKEGLIPIVAHKRNKDNWFVTLSADNFLKIIKETQHEKDT